MFWLNIIETFKHLWLRLYRPSDFFLHSFPSLLPRSFFLLNRFVRPVEMAGSVENCSIILQPVRRRVAMVPRRSPNEENTRRRHAANELVKWSWGFSPREPDVTRSGTIHAVFEFMPANFFRKQCCVRLNIRQNYEICMILRREKNKCARVRDGEIRDMRVWK